MLNRKEKSVRSGLTVVKSAGPKFNIKLRYEDLNDSQKKLLRKQFQEEFGGNVQTFYNRLSSEKPTADEIVFFASIFECKIQELYSRQPPVQPSIYELVRKARGIRPGKQAGLDV